MLAYMILHPREAVYITRGDYYCYAVNQIILGRKRSSYYKVIPTRLDFNTLIL